MLYTAEQKICQMYCTVSQKFGSLLRFQITSTNMANINIFRIENLWRFFSVHICSWSCFLFQWEQREHS